MHRITGKILVADPDGARVFRIKKCWSWGSAERIWPREGNPPPKSPTPPPPKKKNKGFCKQFSELSSLFPLHETGRHEETVWANCLRRLFSVRFIGVGVFRGGLLALDLGWIFYFVWQAVWSSPVAKEETCPCLAPSHRPRVTMWVLGSRVGRPMLGREQP